MDVELDVREQLTKPLVRFRAALARASGEIESPAWKTEELAREVEDLHRREVAPALAELEEAMQEIGARATLRRVASDAEMVKASAPSRSLPLPALASRTSRTSCWAVARL